MFIETKIQPLPASSDTFQMEKVSDALDGRCYDVQVDGSLVYMASQHGGLRIIDVSNPTSPQVLGECDDGGHASQVALKDFVAFIGQYYQGVEAIDVSDSQAPNKFKIYNPGVDSNTRGLCVNGNYLYVGSYKYGLDVLDISNPSSAGFLSKVGYYYNNSGIRDIHIEDTHAFLSTSTRRVEILDLTTPTNPSFIGQYYSSIGNIRGVAVSGSNMYVLADDIQSNQNYMEVINISDPTSPIKMGEIQVSESYGIEVQGSYAYIASINGLRIINISNSTNPESVGYYQGYINAVALQGSKAYLADEYEGLVVVEISTPGSPVKVGSLDISYAPVNDGFVYGDYFFAVCDEEGLVIADVSKPHEPKILASYIPSFNFTYMNYTYTFIDPVRTVYVQGKYAYLGCFYDNFILDISNPLNPKNISSFSCGLTEDIQVLGGYAYSVGASGLCIYDVSDPVNPKNVSKLAYEERELYFISGVGIHVVGDYAYIADDYAGLIIVDISNPEKPEEVGRYESVLFEGNVNSVYVKGSYAYVAAWKHGLEIIDVSTPTNPTKIGGIMDTGMYPRATGVYVAYDYAFLCDSNYGFFVYDISDPTNPVRVANFDDEGYSNKVHVSGSNLFVADSYDGFEIFSCNQNFPVIGKPQNRIPGFLHVILLLSVIATATLMILFLKWRNLIKIN